MGLHREIEGKLDRTDTLVRLCNEIDELKARIKAMEDQMADGGDTAR